jgi:hypothetical protein
MAHYAKLDDDNIVIDVIVIANKNCLDENGNECEEPGRRMCEALTGHKKWKKTSYNTKLGIHYDSNTGEPSEDQSKAYRLNFGYPGMKYDEDIDGFIDPPKSKETNYHYLNPKTGKYEIEKCKPYPEDLQLDLYPKNEYFKVWFWDASIKQWIKVKRSDKENIPNYVFHPEDVGINVDSQQENYEKE